MKKQITAQLTLFLLLFFMGMNLIIANKLSNDTIMEKIHTTTNEAIINFDKSLFMEVRGMCERLLAEDTNNLEALYYKTHAEYRMLVFGLVEANTNLSNQFLSLAIEGGKKLSQINDIASEGKALLAGIYMMNLAIDHSQGPTLMPKIFQLLDEAGELDPENPRTNLIRGQMLKNTPEAFGGSSEKALTEFNKAIKIYEKSKDDKKMINWGYLETLVEMGQTYHAQKQYDKAKSAYEEALKVQPGYEYVVYKLMPDLDTDMNKSVSKNDGVLGKLEIKFYGFENNEGLVRISLSNSEESYNSGKPIKSLTAEIKNNKAEVEFIELPFGEYAVSAFHDEDNDGELGTGAFGIPTEAYGFSNNARGSFGPADFEDAKIELNEKTKTISIRIE